MKLVASLNERTTAATDVILSAAAVGVVIYLQLLTPIPSWRIGLWSWTFGLIALSAGCGAIYHGFSLAESPRKALWEATTACMGMAVSVFIAAVLHDVGGPEAARKALPVLLAAGLLIFAASRMRAGFFAVFIVYEAVALLLALAAYGWLALTGTVRGADWMAAGVAASLIAAALQPVKRLRVSVLWEFDRNGFFHLGQAIGLILLGVGLAQS